MSNKTAMPGDENLPPKVVPNVFMTLLKCGSSEKSSKTEPDMAIKIEPVFEPDYKPTDPRDPRTIVSVMQQRNCSASALGVHERIIAIGTSSGLVLLSDPLGHVDHKNNVFHLHARAVCAIDIDSGGEFVASGGEDGRVVVLDLALASANKDSKLIQLNHDRPVRAVAFDHDFSRVKERRLLVACGGRVILYVNKKASLFSSSEPQIQVLVDNVILILRIAWQPATNTGATSLMAWGNERGEVVLYDEKRRINAGLIRPETCQIVASTSQTNKVSATFAHITLSWLPQLDTSGASSILVVCGSLLRIFRITGGDDPRGSEIVTPRVVQCTHRIPLGEDSPVDTVIASISSTSSNLNYAACSLNNSRNYELMLCAIGDYQGGKLQEQPVSYPFPTRGHDLIGMASLPFDQQTYALARTGALFSIKLSAINSDILTDYVDYLLTIGDAAAAAALLPAIFDNKKAKKFDSGKISWEQWLTKFDQLGQLPAVATYLPVTPDSGIAYPSKDRYDMVLGRLLLHSPSQFESLISRLSPQLYTAEVVMQQLSEALVSDPRNPHYLAALAFLCCSRREFDRAVNLLLDLKHESLFKVVEENSLYHLLAKRVTELVSCGSNYDQVVKILVGHGDKFPAASVISQLKGSLKSHKSSPAALFSYLKRMSTERPEDLQQQDYDLLVTLFCDLDPENLLTFLRSTDLYRLENALAECKKRNKFRECVYLLGKGGKMLEAIDVIIKELGSVEEAVDFCREKGGSSDLWMVLAERVVANRPNLVADLLRLTGTELLDPAEVIKMIPTTSGRLVPGLRQALEASLSDSERQLTLLSSAKNVVGNDLSQVFKQITAATFSASVVVDDRAPCQECREPLSNSHSASMRLIVFSCRHAFHYACLPSAEDANCPVCGRLKERSAGQPILEPKQPRSFDHPSPSSSSNLLSHSLPFSGLLSGLAKQAVR